MDRAVGQHRLDPVDQRRASGRSAAPACRRHWSRPARRPSRCPWRPASAGSAAPRRDRLVQRLQDHAGLGHDARSRPGRSSGCGSSAAATGSAPSRPPAASRRRPSRCCRPAAPAATPCSAARRDHRGDFLGRSRLRGSQPTGHASGRASRSAMARFRPHRSRHATSAEAGRGPRRSTWRWLMASASSGRSARRHRRGGPACRLG